ncbi:hypothetical protein ACRE1U_08440, partial [Helicobacter himalayensis]
VLDADVLGALSLGKSNFHPVITPYVLELCYTLFGKHVWYLFLINLVPLYLGLWLVVSGFYLRYGSYFALLVLLILGVGNIYLGSFISMNYLGMASLIFLGFCGILCLILARDFLGRKSSIALICVICVALFLGILWRHNAIFSVYPAFFVICYLLLRNRNLQARRGFKAGINPVACIGFVRNYIVLLLVSAFLCLGVVIVVPKVLSIGRSNPANHLLLLQIAGSCVPANDSSCFRKEWYAPNRNFEDVKKAYASNPLNGDLYSTFAGYVIFKGGEMEGLKRTWLSSIVSYPKNFLNHETRFFYAMWNQNPRNDDIDGWVRSVIKSPKALQARASHPWHKAALSQFSENERAITFTPLQEKIYSFLYENLPVFNHLVFVIICALILAISSIWLFVVRKKFADSTLKVLLVFTFGASMSAFASAFIIAAMAIVVHSRYMSPLALLSSLGLFGLVASICEARKSKKPR